MGNKLSFKQSKNIRLRLTYCRQIINNHKYGTDPVKILITVYPNLTYTYQLDNDLKFI